MPSSKSLELSKVIDGWNLPELIAGFSYSQTRTNSQVRLIKCYDYLSGILMCLAVDLAIYFLMLVGFILQCAAVSI